MKNSIELDNNYQLKIITNDNDIPNDAIDIRNIKMFNKNKRFLLKIDFNTLERKQYKKILKKLLSTKNVIIKRKVELGILAENKILLGYIINYDESSKEQNDFILAINAIFYDSRYTRYNYIYDTVCDYLDNFFYGKNLCDFKDNKCGEKRNTTSITGCCHHFKIKCLGPLTKLVMCEHLNKENYKCDAKCLGCKLFTCDYLEKKGIKFKIKDILLLDAFFNPLQKYCIKYTLFTPKDKILKRLMIL